MDRLATKKVNVNDHNYQTAKSKLTSSGPTHNLGGISTEHYDYYTNFKTKDDAPHYKQIRSQDYNAQSKRIHAAGNVLTIASGHTFTLARHPHSAANTEHLIIQAQYDLREAGYASSSELSHYRISLVAIPKTYQYRTPRHTPKPQIIGTQGATVTGPAGEEVHTNEYGDIKVQFHWDRYGPMNEKSSDWIRVAQGSAGGSFGSINTPRIGEEVLIDFINGDADRPIVVGRLYNSANPPPWGYPQAAKQSGIKSKSFNSPLENFNELMFDDTAGEELVNFQAQKNLTSLVKNDETRTVNHDRTTTIDNDETVTVHGNRTETVDKDETITIHQNRTETVDQNETITIHQNRQERVDKDETISIGGNRQETVYKNEQILVKGNRKKTVNGNDTLVVDKDRKENVHQSRSLNVDKNNKEFVKLGKSVTVGLGYATQVGTVMNTAVGIMQAEEVGVSKKTMVGKSYSINVGDEFKITVGKSSLVMKSDGSIIITGSTITSQSERENKVIGKDVLINPPGASVGGGEIESNTASTSRESRLPEALAALEAGRDDAAPDATDDPNAGTNLDAPMLGSDSGKYGNLQTEQFMNRQARNINYNAMNHGGSIHSGTLPAYQQEQNKKTFDATVTVLGLAAGGGSAKILYKGSKYLVSKRALDLAKAGKRSVSSLIQGAKKAVPTTTSVPKAMVAGAAGSAVIDMGSQKFLKPNEPFSLKQTVAVATVGAIGGGGGATVANAAKVPYATVTNLPKVYKNTTSMKIFSQQKAAETVGKTAAKDALDD